MTGSVLHRNFEALKTEFVGQNVPLIFENKSSETLKLYYLSDTLEQREVEELKLSLIHI